MAAPADLDKELSGVVRPHLRTQFGRARPVLFTGAGFSLAAQAINKTRVATVGDLSERIWSLVFPGEPFDPKEELQLIYDSALRRAPKPLKQVLEQSLTVDSDSIPGWYETYFSFPWFRVYTLNIDDLETAVSRRYSLPRRVVTISATALVPPRPAHGDLTRDLEVVHLNGTLADVPERVTFSITQYAQRLAGDEPWYARLVADLASRPFVFVGTQLEESPLWQHLELRDLRGSREMKELRPRSYLVTPTLGRARRELLSRHNVTWLSMTAEEFAIRVLAGLEDARDLGLAETAKGPVIGSGFDRRRIPLVDELAVHPDERTEFLLGQEPVWADIQSGRAALRAIDEQLVAITQSRLAEDRPGVVLLTGTAGTGKSASLRRLALVLSSQGHSVAWLDRDSEQTSRQIKSAVKDQEVLVLALDDADIFGTELSPFVRELADAEPRLLVLLAMRSTKIDRFVSPVILADVPRHEVSMPSLQDSDIDGIIDTLTREHRLGRLAGKGRAEQVRVFRDLAGRQLLVAMIEATSGEKLEEKAVAELNELEPAARSTYALVAVASSLRYSLGRDEVLIATGDRTNTALNQLESLLRRGVVVVAEDGSKVRARHRVIADLILDELRRNGELGGIISGLALVAATRVGRDLHRSARPWRFLRQVINHDFLVRTLGVDHARETYEGLQDLLHWDYHYWLQRGSLEVEVNNLRVAENFLGQSRALANGDSLVETEWAYLLFKIAAADPFAARASELAAEARAILVDLIGRRGRTDSYPYHVLGSQGLRWSRRGILGPEARASYLRSLLEDLRAGLKQHPGSRDLATLHDDVKREYLDLAVG